MSRARDFADLAGSADAGGLTGRNLIINGAMLVSQRGTSFTSVADNAYTLDRYRLTENTSAVVDMSQSSEVPSEGGFSSSLKIDVTTAATPSGGQAFCLNYRMEGYDFLPSDYGNSNAKYVTLSFWVKSNVTGTYRLTFIARNGSGNRSIGATYTINSADTWEKKEVSIIPDTASTPYQTTDEGFRIEWYLASGPDRTTGSLPTSWATLDNATRATGQGVNLASSTSNEWYITGVQLEVGEQATPFEHRSYADELRRCQRYFTYICSYSDNARVIGTAHYKSSTSVRAFAETPVVMRARGSLKEQTSGGQTYRFNHTGGNENNDGSTAPTFDNDDQPQMTLVVGGYSGLSSTDIGVVKVEGSGKWLALDAEL